MKVSLPADINCITKTEARFFSLMGITLLIISVIIGIVVATDPITQTKPFYVYLGFIFSCISIGIYITIHSLGYNLFNILKTGVWPKDGVEG